MDKLQLSSVLGRHGYQHLPDGILPFLVCWYDARLRYNP